MPSLSEPHFDLSARRRLMDGWSCLSTLLNNVYEHRRYQSRATQHPLPSDSLTAPFRGPHSARTPPHPIELASCKAAAHA